MPKGKKSTDLAKDPLGRLLMKLALPAILAQVVNMLYNIVDRIYIGHIPGTGAIALTGIGLCLPIILIIMAFSALAGIGGAPRAAIYMGKKDMDSANKILGSCFLMLTGLAVLLMVFFLTSGRQLLFLFGASSQTISYAWGYLRIYILGTLFVMYSIGLNSFITTQGFSLVGMGTILIGAAANIVLDPIFILPWGLGMGAAGAGLATFLSNCVACVYFFVLLYKKRGKTFVCIKLSMFRARREIVFGIFGVGIPASIQNLLNVTGMTVLNNFTSSYGADAVAAMGIVQKINMVPMQVAMGFSQGIMPLVSYNYASGNSPRMKKTVAFTAKIVVCFLTTMTAVFYFGAEMLIRLFMKNQIIVDYGTKFLRGMCLGLVFLAVDFLAVGVFQACGMGKKALVFALLRKVVLEIPALFILNHIYPMYGLAYAQCSAEVILAITACIVLLRLFKKLEKEL